MSDEKITYICMIEGCGNRAAIRGLCRSCHNRATALVKDGETTWEELEKMGLIAPSQRKRTSAFSAMFEKTKHQQQKNKNRE